jgi:hypothetical protein
MRVTYANVMATLAVFAVILGGTAIALPGRGSVTKNDIRKNAVRSKHLQAGAVTAEDVRDGAIGAAEVADGSIGGAEVGDGSIGAADLAATTFSEPVFRNAWGSYGNFPFEIGLDPLGFVHFRGGVSQTSPAQPDIVFTLPGGMRPAHVATFVVPATGGIAGVDVQADGDVVIGDLGGDGYEDASFLDGISFKAGG